MNTSDLKLKIFRQVDSLEKSRIEELYGVFLNYINGLKGINDWDKLSDNQKLGITNAIKEIDSGKGIPHEKVIAKYRKKYSHA
jgi:hypothetical protein